MKPFQSYTEVGNMALTTSRKLAVEPFHTYLEQVVGYWAEYRNKQKSYSYLLKL